MNPERDAEIAVLLVRGQKGDKAAYEEFLLEASAVLRPYLRKRMTDLDSVEDVLQDTLLSIHRARQTYTSGRPVGPWLYAIGSNRMNDFYRRHRRIERNEVRTHATPIESGNDFRLAGLVRDLLTKLPGKQRRVIELLKIQGFSVREVAMQTGMTESSVKVTAFRGYETIRRIFGVDKK